MWARALNLNPDWKRQDRRPWSPEDIAPARKHKKFSTGLQALIHELAGVAYQDIRKPVLARYLAQALKEDEVPSEIQQFFEHAQKIAGVYENFSKLFGLLG